MAHYQNGITQMERKVPTLMILEITVLAVLAAALPNV